MMDYSNIRERMAVEGILGMTNRVTQMSLGQVKASAAHFEAAQDALKAMGTAYDAASWADVNDILVNYIVDWEA